MADHTRHSDIYDASDLSVTLIGAGGIGATTALCLAKMGVHDLIVYDGDTVSPVNIPTQLHKHSDIGKPKALAIEFVAHDFTDDVPLIGIVERIGAADCLVNNVIISGVDSIADRKDIWSAVKNGRSNFYLDARMAAEEFHLYTVWMHGDTSWYEEMLGAESEENVPDLPCTANATFYTSLIAAGHIGHAVAQIANRDMPPRRLIHNIRSNFLMVIP